MAVGKSGKIVIELDPEFKRRLYSALAAEGLTMRVWVLKNAEKFIAAQSQLELSLRPAEGGAR